MLIVGKRNINRSYNTTSNTSLMILPHQLIAYNFLQKNKGIILFHKMGSGKTISSLYAAIKLNKPTIIIGPKSSKKSFIDDFDKLSTIMNISKENFKFYSYKKIINILLSNFDLFADKTIIIDEAHHLRSQTTNMMHIINNLVYAYKIILLTGTPIINHPIDLCVLVNIVKNSEVFNIDKALFDFYYVDRLDNFNLESNSNDIQLKLKNTSELKTKLSNSISYYEPIRDKDSIKIDILYPEVPLNTAQLIEYKKYIAKLINPITKKIVHLETDINAEDFNIDFVSLDTKKKNSFLVATRQLSNTINNDPSSPKIGEVIKCILEGPKPIVVYSNFLANGIFPISIQLNKYGISYRIIKGTTSEDKMNSIINEYNKRLFDVLLISSAASESISLQNTRQMHILEPHFNEAKINQVIGRAIRYKSHDKLNLESKQITIYHWISIFPNIIKYKTADQYLIWLSKKKQQLINESIEVVKEVSLY